TYAVGVSDVSEVRPGVLGRVWQLTSGTVAISFRYRVTGLAAEAAFFALVSLPMLALSILGALKIVAPHLPSDTIDQVKQAVLDAAGHVLNDATVNSTVRPWLDDVQKGGGLGVTVIGVVIMLWSGSRWLNVYVDTITIMYGLNGRRHFLKTRALSF